MSELLEQPDEIERDTADAAEIVADEVLLGARELAREALADITDARTIGADDGHEAHEAHVLTLFFECRLAGYPGWRWAATLARIDETTAPTVLEVELLPGEGAVVAPEWVPWSERLAQYRESQARQAADEAAAAEAAAAELADEDEVDPAEDLLDNDFSDYEDEIDGVDLEAGARAGDEGSDGEDDSDDPDDDSDDDDDEDDDLDEDDDSDEDDDDLEDDSDEDDSDDDDEVDEDGFADLDEHDLHDHGDDDDLLEDDSAAEPDGDDDDSDDEGDEDE